MKQIIFSVQKTFLKVVMVALALNLLGCGAMPESPPQTNRFKDIIDESKLKVGDAIIKDSKTKVLAIIYSENVSKQLTYNKQILEIVNRNMQYESYVDLKDYEIILSEEKLMAAIMSKLKNKFDKIIFAKDIPTAFLNKADYVGVLDIRLDVNTPLKNTMPTIHTANTTLLLINKKLEYGPEIISLVRMESTREHNATRESVLRFYHAMVLSIKLARTKMINDFEVDLNSKIFN